MKRSKVFWDWTSSSTIHGIPHSGNAVSPIVKSFWFIICGACFVLVCYQTYNLIERFHSRPVSVKIKVHSGGFDFPAVTLCNLNAFKKSKVSLVPQLEELERALNIAHNRSANITTPTVNDKVRQKRSVKLGFDYEIGDLGNVEEEEEGLVRHKRAAAVTSSYYSTTPEPFVSLMDFCNPPLIFVLADGSVLRYQYMDNLVVGNNTRCYKQYQTPMTWDAAQAHCEQEAADHDEIRGNIVSFHELEANMFKLFKSGEGWVPQTNQADPIFNDLRENHWIALKNPSEITSEDWSVDWNWVEGNVPIGCPTYRATFLTIGTEGKNCMTMRSPEFWDEADCNDQNWFFCEFVNITQIPPPSPVICEEYPEEILGSEDLCVAEKGYWSKTMRSCFVMFDQIQLSWNDSYDYCANYVANVPNVRGRLAVFPTLSDWKGARDNMTWGSMPWIAGRAHNTYCGYETRSKWRFYEDPETAVMCLMKDIAVDIGDPDEYCMKVENPALWSSENCDTPRSFVCQFISTALPVEIPDNACDGLYIYDWQCACLNYTYLYSGLQHGCFKYYDEVTNYDMALNACQTTVEDLNNNHPAARLIPMKARLARILPKYWDAGYATNHTWVGFKTLNAGCPRFNKFWGWQDTAPNGWQSCGFGVPSGGAVIPKLGDYCLVRGAGESLEGVDCNRTMPRRLCEFYPSDQIPPATICGATSKIYQWCRCADGYYDSETDKCYMVYRNASLNWNDSLAVCRDKGANEVPNSVVNGRLAGLVSEAVWNGIKEKFGSFNETAWFGARAINPGCGWQEKKRWRYVDDATVAIRCFDYAAANLELGNGFEQDCMIAAADEVWDDRPCDEEHYQICEFNDDNIALPPSPEICLGYSIYQWQCDCINGTYAFGKCYKQFDAESNWHDAQSACSLEAYNITHFHPAGFFHNLTGNLGSAPTAEEWEFLGNGSYLDAWIGMRSIDPDCVRSPAGWRWASDYNTFTNCPGWGHELPLSIDLPKKGDVCMYVHGNDTLAGQECNCTMSGSVCEFLRTPEPVAGTCVTYPLIEQFCYCIDGYYSPISGSCYQVQDSEQSWEEGYGTCFNKAMNATELSGIRGRLAHFTFADVYPIALAESNPASSAVWLGLKPLAPACGHDSFTQHWRWVENVNETVGCFDAVNMPEIGAFVYNETCVVAHNASFWETNKCEAVSRALCEFVNDDPLPAEPTICDGVSVVQWHCDCINGTFIDNTCFFHFEGEGTWNDGFEQCGNFTENINTNHPARVLQLSSHRLGALQLSSEWDAFRDKSNSWIGLRSINKYCPRSPSNWRWVETYDHLIYCASTNIITEAVMPDIGDICFGVGSNNELVGETCNSTLSGGHICELFPYEGVPPNITACDPLSLLEDFCYCNNGYQSPLTNTCFKRLESGVSWDEAYGVCSFMANKTGVRGRLAVFPSVAAWKDVHSGVGGGGWIGQRALVPECGNSETKHWRWMEGETVVDCVAEVTSTYHIGNTSDYCMYASDNETWTGKPCDTESAYICEFLEDIALPAPPDTCEGYSIQEWQCDCINGTFIEPSCFKRFDLSGTTWNDGYDQCSREATAINGEPAGTFQTLRSRVANLDTEAKWDLFSVLEGSWIGLRSIDNDCPRDPLSWRWVETFGELALCPVWDDTYPASTDIIEMGEVCMGINNNSLIGIACNSTLAVPMTAVLCEFVPNTTAILTAPATCGTPLPAAQRFCQCKSGYYSSQSGSCFFYEPDTLSWNDSHVACQSTAGTFADLRGRLAVFDTKAVWEEVHAALAPNIGGWIGLRAIVPECGYSESKHLRWVEGEAQVVACAQAAEFPLQVAELGLNDQYCAASTPDIDQWQMIACDRTTTRVCEFVTDSTTIIPATPPDTCESYSIYEWQCDCINGTYVSPSCFKHFDVGTPDWNDAYDQCSIEVASINADPAGSFQSLRSRLANLDTTAKWDQFSSLEGSWIGLRSIDSDCPRDPLTWRWLEGYGELALCPIWDHTYPSEVGIPEFGDICMGINSSNSLVGVKCNTTAAESPFTAVLCEFVSNDTAVLTAPASCGVSPSASPRYCQCKNGYFSAISNSCFLLYDEQLSWNDSHTACANSVGNFPDLRGRLAVFDQISIWQDVHSALDSTAGWIGLKAIAPDCGYNESKHLRWMEGEEQIMSCALAAELPTQLLQLGANDYFCALATEDINVWQMMSCEELKYRVCEFVTDSTTIIPAEPPETCDDYPTSEWYCDCIGGRVLGNFCLKYYPHLLPVSENWPEAYNSCLSEAMNFNEQSPGLLQNSRARLAQLPNLADFLTIAAEMPNAWIGMKSVVPACPKSQKNWRLLEEESYFAGCTSFTQNDVSNNIPMSGDICFSTVSNITGYDCSSGQQIGRICEFLKSDVPKDPVVADCGTFNSELEKLCECIEGDMITSVGVERCVKRFPKTEQTKTTWERAYDICANAAIPGTRGRLVNVEDQALYDFLRQNEINGWIGMRAGDWFPWNEVWGDDPFNDTWSSDILAHWRWVEAANQPVSCVTWLPDSIAELQNLSYCMGILKNGTYKNVPCDVSAPQICEFVVDSTPAVAPGPCLTSTTSTTTTTTTSTTSTTTTSTSTTSTSTTSTTSTTTSTSTTTTSSTSSSTTSTSSTSTTSTTSTSTSTSTSTTSTTSTSTSSTTSSTSTSTTSTSSTSSSSTTSSTSTSSTTSSTSTSSTTSSTSTTSTSTTSTSSSSTTSSTSTSSTPTSSTSTSTTTSSTSTSSTSTSTSTTTSSSTSSSTTSTSSSTSTSTTTTSSTSSSTTTSSTTSTTSTSTTSTSSTSTSSTSTSSTTSSSTSTTTFSTSTSTTTTSTSSTSTSSTSTSTTSTTTTSTTSTTSTSTSTTSSSTTSSSTSSTSTISTSTSSTTTSTSTSTTSTTSSSISSTTSSTSTSTTSTTSTSTSSSTSSSSTTTTSTSSTSTSSTTTTFTTTTSSPTSTTTSPSTTSSTTSSSGTSTLSSTSSTTTTTSSTKTTTSSTTSTTSITSSTTSSMTTSRTTSTTSTTITTSTTTTLTTSSTSSTTSTTTSDRTSIITSTTSSSTSSTTTKLKSSSSSTTTTSTKIFSTTTTKAVTTLVIGTTLEDTTTERITTPSYSTTTSTKAIITTTEKRDDVTTRRPTTKTTTNAKPPAQKAITEIETTTMEPRAQGIQPFLDVEYTAPELIDILHLKGTQESALSDLTAVKESIPFYLRDLTDAQLMELGYQLEEFFDFCQYEDIPCRNHKELHQWADVSVGNCFTFNYKNHSRKYFTRAGSLYGLHVIISVGNSEYLSFTENSGLKLFIHDPYQPVFPEIEGFTVPSGHTQEFAIRKNKVIRQEHPYGDCVQNSKNINPYYYNGDYTSEGCIRSCYQEAVHAKCGCGDPRYPLALDGSQQYCSVLLRDCVLNFAKETLNKSQEQVERECDCRMPCKEEMFSVTGTKCGWSKHLEKTHNGKIELRIFFEQMGYVTFEEQPAYSIVNLLSDFGSTTGVLLGASVLSLIEVLFLFFGLIFGVPVAG